CRVLFHTLPLARPPSHTFRRHPSLLLPVAADNTQVKEDVSLSGSASARKPRHRLPAALSAILIAIAGFSPALQSEQVAPGGISGHVTLTSRMRGSPISTSAYASRAVTH